MYLLRAFFPIFLILFIALPIIGANLGKKNKLGTLIGTLAGVISITVMLRFLPWKAYDPIYFVVFAVTGWILGKQREADRGIKSGAVKGTVISIIIAIVFYLPFEDLTAIFVWLGTIYLSIILGKRINIGNGSAANLGIAIGIVLDVVILLFFIFGFSVY